MTTDNTVAVEATIPTPALPAQPKRKFDLPTPGEYLAAMHIGGETFRNVAAAATEFMKSKQTALQAAAGDVITTDTPGLLPVPVLGPVFQDLNYIQASCCSNRRARYARRRQPKNVYSPNVDNAPKRCRTSQRT
jgi:hypothetical protein